MNVESTEQPTLEDYKTNSGKQVTTLESLIAKDDQRVPLAWLASLRILLGVMFLTTWASNLSKGFYKPDGLISFFTEVFPLTDNPLPWYARFIEEVILPGRGVFAPFQLVGEFLLGIALLLGIFTPYTSLIAGFFILNTFLLTFGRDWPWSYGLILGILALVLLTRAGRSLGIDNILLRRFGKPRLPFLW